jgi:hypothetical protein
LPLRWLTAGLGGWPEKPTAVHAVSDVHDRAAQRPVVGVIGPMGGSSDHLVPFQRSTSIDPVPWK